MKGPWIVGWARRVVEAIPKVSRSAKRFTRFSPHAAMFDTNLSLCGAGGGDQWLVKREGHPSGAKALFPGTAVGKTKVIP